MSQSNEIRTKSYHT